MTTRNDRSALNRRHFVGGLGVAALAANVGGEAHAAPPPAPLPVGDVAGFPMTSVAAIDGAHIVTRSKFDFVPVSGGAGSGLAIEPDISRGAYNPSPGGVLVASLDVPSAARLRQVDVYGYRLVNGKQDWHLRKVDVFGNEATLTTRSVTASGPLHATFGANDTNVALLPGERVVIVLEGSSALSTALGVVYQYTEKTSGLVLFGDPAGAGDPTSTTPRSPVRVYDSRFDPAGKLARGVDRRINVANEIAGTVQRTNVVPLGARAIAYNLTITDTESDFGYLSVVPAGEVNINNSAINWDRPGTTIANGLIVGISAQREVVVRCDGNPDRLARTHVIIDITGYFV